MARHIRHIWAKANQHIKVHRAGRQDASNRKDNDNMLYIIIAIVVFLWIIL